MLLYQPGFFCHFFVAVDSKDIRMNIYLLATCINCMPGFNSLGCHKVSVRYRSIRNFLVIILYILAITSGSNSVNAANAGGRIINEGDPPQGNLHKQIY